MDEAATLPPIFGWPHIGSAVSPSRRPLLAPLSPRRIVFRLKLFGSASIEGPDGPLTGRPVQRRRIALLALLAVARGRGLTRDKLIGWLWPDADPERGRAQLSDSVYRVNRAVGGEALVAIGDGLRIDPGRLPCDVWEFGEALARRDWQRAVELHAAPFLDGFYLTGADELERWVDARREAMARDRARALEALATAADESGTADDAVRWWRMLATQDPYSSRVAVRLMRALDRAGDRAGALRHGALHTRLLADEMGLEPDTELVAFEDALRAPHRSQGARPAKAEPVSAPPPATATPARGEGALAKPVPSADGARPPSVAVLPFVNLSAEPDNEYFADGITEDIIAHLSRIGALNVISRASIMRFRSREQGLREIGATLGAATVLAGSVRRVGDRVRIVAQLVDAESGRCLWAETYDRRLTDVFAIQSDVALQIGAALHAQLSPEEKTRIRREPTANLQAYQLYLQGRHHFVQFTGESMRQGIRYFEQAIALDADFALAYVGVAMAYEELAETGEMDPKEAYEKARAAAAKALAIDDGLAEAHCILGQLAAVSDFDWVRAEQEFQRSLALRPAGADTYDLYGRMCASIGRLDEAVAMERRARELDPMAHRSDFASALIRAGRYDEAVRAAESGVEFDPGYARVHATLGWAYLKTGRTAEGLAELEKAVALAPRSTAWLAQLGQARALTGDVDAGRRIARELEEMSRRRYVAPYHLAYVYTGLGEDDRAIDCLERAREERSGAVYGVKHSFLFTTLHSHPRFQVLIQHLNLG